MGTFNRQSFITIKFMALAAITMGPRTLSAYCGPAPNDGWGSNYPAYASWCRSCGGRPYNNNGVGCDMSGATSGGYTGGSSYQTPVPNTVEGAILQGIQTGIQQGMQNAARQRQQQQAENERSAQKMAQDNAEMQNNAIENARLLQERNETVTAREKRLKEQRQKEIMSQLRGFNSATSTATVQAAATEEPLRLKDLSAAADSANTRCLREDDFNTYRRHQSDRREVLDKLEAFKTQDRAIKNRIHWCKLNSPLPPSPSGTDYCSQKPVYETRMQDWRRKCALAVESTSLPPAATQEANAKEAAAKPAKTGSAPHCLGVYDAEAASCSPDDLTAFSNCINGAIRSFNTCLNFDNPNKGTPEPKQ